MRRIRDIHKHDCCNNLVVWWLCACIIAASVFTPVVAHCDFGVPALQAKQVELDYSSETSHTGQQNQLDHHTKPLAPHDQHTDHDHQPEHVVDCTESCMINSCCTSTGMATQIAANQSIPPSGSTRYLPAHPGPAGFVRSDPLFRPPIQTR